MGFKQGQSGNPAGRPRGSKDKRTELRDLLQPHAPDLIEKLVEMALGGDMTAMKICIDRLIPMLKPADTNGVTNQAIVMQVLEIEQNI